MTAESFHEHSIMQSKGSVNPYINFRDLAWYEFTLPSLEFQAELARLLSTQDEYVARLDVARAEADQVLHALMRRLLADGNAVPSRPITELTSVLLGRQLAPQYRLGVRPIPYLRAANVVDGELAWSDINSMDFTKDDEQRYAVKVGDILMVEGGNPDTVGAPALVRETLLPSVCLQKSLLRVRVRDSNLVYPDYLYWHLRARFLSGDFERMASGTKLHHFTLSKLESLKVPVPAFHVQKERTLELASVRDVLGRCRRAQRSANALRSSILRRELEQVGSS
jgi:type I restriction enzyme S subunit